MGPDGDDRLRNNNSCSSSSRSAVGSSLNNKCSGTHGGHSASLEVSVSDDQTLCHTKSRRAVIPLPYKFRPIPYGPSDQPWVVDLLGG